MSWFKLDDGFHSNAKVIAAGNEAVGLYVRCASYAAQHLTDGLVPEQIARLYGDDALIDTLLRTKLWRRARSGYKMRDYLQFNPSREDVMALREKRSEAGRRGGVASGNTRSKRQANASGLLEPPSPPLPSVVDVYTDGARAPTRPLSKPGFSSSSPNGAATRQPPPVSEAIEHALHPHGRHARKDPQPGDDHG